jgi:hypothetical protein
MQHAAIGIGAVVWLMAGLFVFVVDVPLLLPVCLFVCFDPPLNE